MMGRHDFEVCNCRCHTNPDAIKHLLTCCYPCKTCGQRIKRHSITRHEEACATRREAMNKEFEIRVAAASKTPTVTQEAVRKWVVDCFGEEPTEENSPERANRFLEEAMELVQSAGMDFKQVVQLAIYVYNRPAETEIDKEFGGTLTTLMALAQSKGVDLMTAANKEFARMQANVEKIRAKQKAKPDEVKG